MTDFSVPKDWTGWWLVLDTEGVLLCKVRGATYDGALNRARNKKETNGKAFMVVPEEKRG